MKVQIIKMSEDVTALGYSRTSLPVEVVKFSDYMLGKTKTRYRVDVNGRTVRSLIDTKAEAMRIARQELKKVSE